MKRFGTTRYPSVKYFSSVVVKQVLISTVKHDSNSNDQVISKTLSLLHSSVNSLSKSSGNFEHLRNKFNLEFRVLVINDSRFMFGV